MKRLFFILPILLLAGCVSTGIFGTTSHQVEKQNNRITAIQDKLEANKDKEIDQAQQLTFGTDIALKQVTNQEPAITVAKELNERVEAVIGLPALAQQKAMAVMVSDLLSNNIYGRYKLAEKDYEIVAIQQEENFLVKQKDIEINKALDLSQSIALKADSTKASLDKYQGWFGLSAVFMGLKQFLTTSLWALIGLGIAFVVLRVLSTVNPIAGAIFAIVDVLFAWIVNAIRVIAPKALTVAGTVSTEVYNGAKSALTSIVDSVETVKLQANASGKPATIEDLLNTAELSMTSEDKALIEQIKIKLKWIKPTVQSTVAPVVTS